MNIGIFTDTFYPQVSGVGTSIATLRNQLERMGHTVYIFTTTDPKIEKKIYERNTFRFTSIPFVSFTDRRIAVRGLFQAYEVAKELNLDIIHTQTEFSMGLIGKFVAKNLKIPCLHTYHTMYEDYLHYVAKGKILKPSHVKVMTKSFCSNMSGIVAPSERVLNTLRGYGVSEPISIIPTGVDLTRFEKGNRTGIRAKYSISPDTPLILTLSRLAFEKDIDRLLNDFPEIKKRIPDAKLMIVGEGPARTSLERQAEDLFISKDVIFTGEIPNDKVTDYYHAADLFVSTSVSESQGLTYIEAVASGLKVVTTHSPYTDDLFDDPNIGTTFEDQGECVEKTVEYLKNPERYSDETLRLNKLREISADLFGKRVVEYYDECLEMYSKSEKYKAQAR